MMIIPMIGDQVDLVMIAPWMNFYEEITNGDIEIGDEKKNSCEKKRHYSILPNYDTYGKKIHISFFGELVMNRYY